MPKPKIDIRQLDRMLRSGKSQKECAQVFGVTEAAVSKAKKRLKNTIVRTASLEKANEIMEFHLDMAGQLRKINHAINDELDKTRHLAANADVENLKPLQEIIIKFSSEIRHQLALQIKIFQAWYDVKTYAVFQDEVLRILDEMSPGVRSEAIRRLWEAGALRGTTKIMKKKKN
jgi:predicted transcriptional regulator